MRSVLLSITAIALALFIGALILWASGASPLLAYWALLKGAFGDAQALQRTLEKATPLVFSGLAVAFAFKASLFNIGAQGQLLLGAIIAAAVGFGVSGLPPYIHAPLALLAGVLMGTGSGLYLPANIVAVTKATPKELRGSAFSLFTASWDAGGLLGPPLAGILVRHYGEPAIFPLAAGLALFTTLSYLRLARRVL